jgi:hypothetical protein
MLAGNPISLAEFMATNLWPGLLLWTLIYCSDHLFTMVCAGMYRKGVHEKIGFEGSLEITPYFQKDVDALRKLSPRFIRALVLSLIALSLLWWLARQVALPAAYLFVLGAFVLAEVAVHMRHLRNFFLFRALLRSNAVRGRIEYPRPLILRQSATEFLIWSGLFAVFFLITREWFVLGGAVECAVVAFKHRKLAEQHVAKAAAAKASATV